MEDICTGCLCTGRKLLLIDDTGFYQLYSQILNEISLLEVSQVSIRVCWECCALLKKFERFKAQVKRNYTELLWNVPPTCHSPHLTTSSVYNLSYPEQLKDSVKEEVEDIKTEAEDEHMEPVAFINNLSVERDSDVEKVDSKATRKSRKKPKQKKPTKSKIKVKKKRKTKKSTSKLKDVEEPMSEGVSDTDVLLEDDAQEEKLQEDNRLKGDSEEGSQKSSKVVEDENNKTAEVEKPLSQPVLKPKPVELLPEKPQCAECGKTFSSRKTYRYHLNVLHKGNNRYPCPRCGKIYQWKSNLGRHMRTHKAVDAGELYCEECDKSFASVATYRQHLRISRRHVSENEFSFTCNECGKKFVNKTRLRDHIDWEHLKKIKFRCQLCNKPFKCHTSLYVHLQNVHRNKEKKDNLCHVCGKSYQNAAKLKYHIIALHTGETPYQCSQCSAAFGWYSSLYRHIREVHYKVKTQPKKTKRAKKLEIEPPPYMNYHP